MRAPDRCEGTVPTETNPTLLNGEKTTQTIVDRMRIHYNFIRPHMALNGKTPAEESGIAKLQRNKWRSLIRKSIEDQ